jgi:hypothetical protein
MCDFSSGIAARNKNAGDFHEARENEGKRNGDTRIGYAAKCVDMCAWGYGSVSF